MRALVFHTHGEAEVVRYEEVPDPQPKAGEVLVRVAAAALNHLDIWVRRGWPGLALPMPHIGGADGAGTIAAIGEKVFDLQPGDRVAINPGYVSGEDEYTARAEHSLSPHFHILGESRSGTFAEYIAVPATSVVPLPEAANFAATAAASLVYLTAWRMLMVRGALQKGETVVIVGAGGGVNSAALQVAKLAGAEVFALTSSEAKMQQARDLGADHVLDYTAGDWVKTIRQMTDKRGVDVVVDNVGQATFAQSLRVLTRGGRLLTVGNTSGHEVNIDNRLVFAKQLSIIGSTMGSPIDFKTVMAHVWSGRLRGVIDCTMPLMDGRAAQERLERGEQFGKIVLTTNHA